MNENTKEEINRTINTLPERTNDDLIEMLEEAVAYIARRDNKADYAWAKGTRKAIIDELTKRMN